MNGNQWFLLLCVGLFVMGMCRGFSTYLDYRFNVYKVKIDAEMIQTLQMPTRRMIEILEGIKERDEMRGR